MKAGLFPGQGIHPRAVADALPPSHPRVEQASAILGFDLASEVRRPLRTTLPTTIAQPAIFVAGVISYDAARAEGESFDVFLGHSLGEYTALVAAGSIPFEDGVNLIRARAAAMAQAARRAQGGMAAVVGLDSEAARSIAALAGTAVANDNSPSELVVAGSDAALATVAALTKEAGGRCVRLRVEAPFHTDAMRSARGPLAAALMEARVRLGTTPVISNVSAARFRSPGEIRRLLVEQLTGMVRFRECVRRLSAAGVDDFVDLGPGDVVGKLARATVAHAKDPAHA